MNSGSAGRFNRLKYDNCASQRADVQRTDPFKYVMYEGKHEHNQKCTDGRNFYHPYDLVDIETELRGVNRSATKCPQFQYNPSCKKSDRCLSTFDETVPVVMAPEVCPIVKSNIPRQNNPGYNVKQQKASCMTKNN
jgi:hypothetical protein